MGAPTFTTALEQAAQLAHTAMPDKAAKIGAAAQLVKDGRVFQLDSGAWQVESSSTPGTVYTVNGHCSCKDAHYRDAMCKHRLATYLSRKALRLMAAPASEAPPAVQRKNSSVEPSQPLPEAPQEPRKNSSVTLPEAPASATAKVMVHGYEVLLTVRDTDESRLLARLQAVLARPDVRPIPKPAPRAQGQWKQRKYSGAA
jgi:hypothetical protein